ncbi:MAG: signal peptidase I [Ruminiclostridium sp.]|nr:signal peptidase I [Ruminiclostridium sp.]
MEDKELNKSVLVPAADVKTGGVAGALYSWYDTLMHAFLAVVVIFLFLTKMSTVDGQSMEPTLLDQQRLMVTDFLYTPAYNDIVVVWAPDLPTDGDDNGKAIVKRVVGLPGDTISIDYINGRVSRNGELLPIEVNDGILYEDGHMINTYTNYEEGQGGEFTVPENHIFVMGDNRNNSTDSRSRMVGFVDMREIVGKAYLRVWPLDKIGFMGDK